MTTTTEMPASGQFVAVYVYREQVWSLTLKWGDDTLTMYNSHTDEYEETGLSATWLRNMNPIFITA